MKYIIVDDDNISRESTIQYLQLVPNCECIGDCENVVEATQKIHQELPDVLILDVEMPGLTGLQFAKSLTQLPLIIFISSHPHYAAEAFEVDAIDYLVKPIAPERLVKAMEKARNLIDMKKSISDKDGFNKTDDNSFFIKEKNAFVRILNDDVIYIESLADFVTIYLKTGEKKIALVNLKKLEHQLPSAIFVRISRTHIVNKQKITALDSSSVMLEKIQLPVGKLYTNITMQTVLGKSVIKRHS